MSDIAKEIITQFVENEAKGAYLDYSMSVITGRALPDIRDGLKPVHRRVLYAMESMGNYSNKPYKKSARVVGDVIGKYHPHGDTAAYDTIVRMAQDFSMRYVLVDGQGNFGSVDGDSPAAMRYTEVRMAKISHEILSDLDKDTVDFRPNYDENEIEPVVLPTRIPNLLINGSSGIAVGMATNIPPHNLSEVIDAVIALTKKPDMKISEIMKYIPGPDFPTAGIITIDKNDSNGIRSAYETGKGKVIMQAKADIPSDGKSSKKKIIVTELPYQVNKARLIEKIAELVRDKKLDGISELRDESDKDGMRIVIEIKKSEIAEVILNNLYQQTQMRTSFGINMVALVEGEPRTVNLKDILLSFIEHRKEIVIRRTRYELKKAREKAHILEGLAVALSNIDEIIKLIKESKNSIEAKTKLLSMKYKAGSIKKMLGSSGEQITKPNGLDENIGLIKDKYIFSDTQAQAILEMKLSRLTALEQDKITLDYKDLLKKIKEFQKILNDRSVLMDLIRNELSDIKKNFGDERKTDFEELVNFSKEDLTKEEDLVVTLSNAGYVKAQPIHLYTPQKRGGRGKTAATVKDEDFIEKLFVANSHDTILCFSSLGKVYWLKVYDIPQSGRSAKGKAIVNILPLAQYEKITAIQKVSKYDENLFVLMATSKGVIKKTKLSDFSRPRSSGLIAINLKDGDNLIEVSITNGEKQIMLFSSAGKAIRFNESDVTCVGRSASGVKGITIDKDNNVISMITSNKDGNDDILIATENGYGKRTDINEFSLQKRSGKGNIAVKTSDRNGKVIGALKVRENDDLMLITDHGTLVRTSVKDIRQLGRNTQGVRLQTLNNNEKLSQIEKVEEERVDDDKINTNKT
ncbi:MAG: DNA gyrase subunit A [Pseudomonadota bacterium]|jgi:DNA gyrase subunit A|nr:DNA gyrase subunit A [Pseudomonadota bacterium]|tara:strand:+ start:2252 stop:4831 length:2580 start_codon:yes stop_codon:yes gene_type:complete